MSLNYITTVRQADKIAKQLGIKRGAGTYNGAAYWTSKRGEIITMSFLETLAIRAGLV